LRDVKIDTKSNGLPISIPVEVSSSKIDQYVKRFIEITSYNLQDGSGLAARFRSYHGGTWTIPILQAALHELRHPELQLDLSQDLSRESLIPFFEDLLSRHQRFSDADFGYPPEPSRRAKLPI
jgi:hypothetical protein